MEETETQILKDIIEEETQDGKLTKEDAIFEIVTLLLKSQSEQMKQIIDLSTALQANIKSIGILDMRLSVLENVLLPHLKEIKGIGDC